VTTKPSLRDNGEYACPQDEHPDAEQHDDGANKAPRRGSGYGVAVADGGQRLDGPPHGIRNGPEDLESRSMRP